MIDRLAKLLFGELSSEQVRLINRMAFRGILLIHIAWACGWLAMMGLPLRGFATESAVSVVKEELSRQMSALKIQVDGLETAVSKAQRQQQRAVMEGEVRRLDQEIFNIEARLQELSQAQLRPDRIYAERLSELRRQKSYVESRLSAFLRANPDIAGDTP